MKESDFKKVLMRKLHEIDSSFFFSKEAGSIRGLPDIIGCMSGIFVGLEVKKSRAEAMKKTGRIVLQRYNLEKIQECGGFGEFVYPENMEWVIDSMIEFCQGCDEFPSWH